MTNQAESIQLLVEQAKQQLEQFTRESQESFNAVSSSARDEFISRLDNFLTTELTAFRREVASLSQSPTLRRLFGSSPLGRGAGTFLDSLFSGFLRLRSSNASSTPLLPETLNLSRSQANAQAVTELSRGQRNL